MGRKGSGKSTLANMLVNGDLSGRVLPTVGNRVRGTTSTCQTYVGRGWTVTDTMDFGEVTLTLDHEAYQDYDIMSNFLKEFKGRYSHIVFVYERSSFDIYSRILWQTFLEVFKGGERNLVVLFTKVDDERWLEENRERIEEDFPVCKQFLQVDFPGVIGTYEFVQNQLKRKEEVERLQKQMKEISKSSPWVVPDISLMSNVEIDRKASNTLHGIYKATSSIGSIRSEIDFMERLNLIYEIAENMEIQCRKVRVCHIQCRHLFSKIFEVSLELRLLPRIAALPNRAAFFSIHSHWRKFCDSFNKLHSCVSAARDLVLLCADNKKWHDAALTLFLTASYKPAFSRFALLLRELGWSLDALCFLTLYPPRYWGAHKIHQYSWFKEFHSKYKWCEWRCRLVFAENHIGARDDECLEADMERQARDKKDWIKYLHCDTSPRACPFKPRSKSELNHKHKSVLKNRFHNDSSFSVEHSGVPGCYWIQQKLEDKIIEHIGGGSFKAVHKCEWLGKEVAIASFHSKGVSRKDLEEEAGLLARVQHPNVVTLIGCAYDEKKQQGFIVTELMEGSLRSLLNMNNEPSGTTPFSLQYRLI